MSHYTWLCLTTRGCVSLHGVVSHCTACCLTTQAASGHRAKRELGHSIGRCLNTREEVVGGRGGGGVGGKGVEKKEAAITTTDRGSEKKKKRRQSESSSPAPQRPQELHAHPHDG